MWRPLAIVLLLVVVSLAGCLAAPTDGDVTPTDIGERATDQTAMDRSGSAPSNLSTRATPVTVVEVTDGDTVDVQYRNGTTETVRLVGVDTPEVHVATEPAEFGVPDSAAGRDCLRRWGGRATGALDDLLAADGTVGLATDPAGDRRGSYGRLLGYLVLPNGTAANAVLLRHGLARHYDGGFARNDAYAALARDARRADRGLWRCRDPASASSENATAAVDDDTGLGIASIDADAPGNDHEHPNGETVVVANEGDAAQDLTGYTVEDAAGHTYGFPSGFVLDAGDRVALHTGTGEDTDGALYWGRDRAVWNNDGDTVTVRDDDGAVVARAGY